MVIYLPFKFSTTMESNYTTRYNKIIKIIVIIGDLCICSGLFYAFYLSAQLLNKHTELVASLPQVLITITLCYMVCAIHGGIILHLRKVFPHQIVMRVFRNVFYFSILSGVLLTVGTYMNVFSLFFPAYVSALFLCISMYRLGFRTIVKHFRTRGRNLRHVVLVGSSSNIIELYHELTDDLSTGYRVAGYFDDSPNESMPDSCKYLGTPCQVQEYLHHSPQIHFLYCSLPSRQSDIILPIINYCENNLVHFYSLPNLHNYLHNRVFFNMMGDVPYLSLRPDPLSRTENKVLKRAFDIVFSLLFLCTIFPIVFCVVAIITKITMPGPIFFKQKRNGLNDKEFYCIKFRSMKVNNEADSKQATKDDPRKTRWGNIMRKTNIDELPQFINVLMGDMSIVGPRPHMLKHTEEYSKLINKYMVRHFVKPGITGWSQVTGYRGETKELKDMEGRVRGDIWYIEHWSFWLDMYIIYKTIRNAIKGEKNAY